MRHHGCQRIGRIIGPHRDAADIKFAGDLIWKEDANLDVEGTVRYVDLPPVVAAAARTLGKEAVVVDSEADDTDDSYDASWILMGNKSSVIEAKLVTDAGEPLEPRKGLRTWTDDYSSLWPVLK